MTDPSPLSQTLRTAVLQGKPETPFDLRPDEAARAALAAYLGIPGIPALRFQGSILPSGRRDLVLEGVLTARVVQPCVVTLDPVTTDLKEPVSRRYVEDYAEPEGEEVEMPEDDGLEPLPQAIDIGAVATEALALALPLYPRSPGAVLGETVHAAKGVVPLRDADLRPFAGLATLAGLTGGTNDQAAPEGTGEDAADGADSDDTEGNGSGGDA